MTISSWPANEKYLFSVVEEFENTKEIISQIRNYRKEKNISFKTPLDLYYIPNGNNLNNIEIIKKIAIIDKLEESTKEKFDVVTSFIIKKFEFFIPMEEGFDKEKEINKLNKELDYNRSFLKSVEVKLKNENFVKNAPENIIEKEKQKIKDAKQKIESIIKSIEELT